MKYLIKCKLCDEVGVCTSCGLCDGCHAKKSLTDVMDEPTQFTLVNLLHDKTVQDIAIKAGETTFENLIGNKLDESGVREGFSAIGDAVLSILNMVHEHTIHMIKGRVLIENDEDEQFCRNMLSGFDATEDQIEEIVALNKANNVTPVDADVTVVDFINSIGGEDNGLVSASGT